MVNLAIVELISQLVGGELIGRFGIQVFNVKLKQVLQQIYFFLIMGK